MKKLLSIALAVVMMCTLALSVSAYDKVTEDHSFLPKSADKFGTLTGGDGTITVTKEGDSFVFESDKGWPQAFYWDEECWLYFNESEDLYLYYDFEVVTGATNVTVLFAGQDPEQMAALGNTLCLNGVIDPSYVDATTGNATADVPVGKYTGKVAIGDMNYNPLMKDDEGNMLVSGVKVFAVGENAKVIVNEISVGPARDGGNDEEETTTTTTKKEDTKATTTTKKAANKDDSTDSAKTGDVSNAALFVIVAVAAAGVVTLSAVSKKAKSR